jgi:hypothetical protein
MTGSASTKRDFFVSFNQADRAWATWIAWVLEEAGYSVWFQDWDFRGNFVEHMNRAHAQAHRTLAVLSDSYFGSDFTLAEWSARFAQDPAAREDRLVPVKVGPLTGESILGPIVYADLTGCEEAEAHRRLLGRVKKAVDAGYRDKVRADRGGIAGGRDVSMRTSHGLLGQWVVLLALVAVGAVLLVGSLLGNRITAIGGVATGGDVSNSKINIIGPPGTRP